MLADIRFRSSSLLSCGVLLTLAISPGLLRAHALLQESTPSSGSTIQGGQVEVKLRFNARIDVKRSQVELITVDQKSTPLALDSPESPEIVTTHVALRSGTYLLRWQVLAVDGHITRGEIPFIVK